LRRKAGSRGAGPPGRSGLRLRSAPVCWRYGIPGRPTPGAEESEASPTTDPNRPRAQTVAPPEGLPPGPFVLLLAVIFGLVFMQRTGPGLVGPTLIRTFHITPVVLSAMTVVQYLAYAVLQIPVGYWGQRYGPERFIVLGTILDGVGTLVFGGAPSFAWIVVARFLVGIGDGFIWLNLVMVLARRVPPAAYGRALGLVQMGGTVGALMASIPLAGWIEAAGWRLPFVVMGAVLVTFGVLARRWLGVPGGIRPAGAPAGPALGRHVRIVLGYGARTYAPMATGFGFMGTFMGFSSLMLVPYLEGAYGLTRVGASALEAAGLVGMVFAAPLVGALSDRVGRKGPLVAFGLVNVLVWAIMAARPTGLPDPAMVVLFAAMGCSAGSILVLMFAALREVQAPEDIGVASGLANAANFLAAGIVPLAMGAALTHWAALPPGPRFGLMLLAPLATALVGLLGALRMPVQAPRPAPAKNRYGM
jgi:MFS family permease